MSNFPHSTSLATSLSTSPYATQSNLETLIQNARAHPHPRRTSQSSVRSHHFGGQYGPMLTPITPVITSPDLPSPSERPLPQTAERRPSEHQHPSARPRIGTIREASYNEGALLLDSSEDEGDALLKRHRRESRGSRSSSNRRNFGGVSDPVGLTPVRRGSNEATGRTGNSRSRSTARTPPRRNRMSMAKPGDISTPSDDNEEDYFDNDGRRGRATDSRPLSRSSSPLESRSDVSLRGRGKARRSSMATTTRFAGDSSGDEGGDVARGLAGTGGASMMGMKGGNGMMPGGAQGAVLGQMDVDPAEELLAEDLEVPLDKDGLEVRDWSEALRAEVAIVLRSTIPVFFTQFAEWSLVLASVISIGHQGTTELAASSLASMTASVSSFSILQGLATAMDTLLPAAWASSEPSRVGLWTQRMAVVMLFSTIPMYVLWWNIEGVMIAAGQEPRVALLASQYLRCMSFGIPGYGGTIVVKKYLQAQGLMQIPTYVLFIVSPLNVLFNYLLVWGPDPIRIGFNGGAIATAISYTLNFILLLLWAIYYGPVEAMHPVQFSHMFSKLGTVTSLGLAGTIMVSSEWWAWEACALAASLLGPVNLAAQSVLLSTTSTFFQVPAALGIASAVRVGNLLGAGRGWEAKWASRACLFLSIFFASINSLVCIVFRKNWGYLFNNDAEVVRIVAGIMPYIGLFQIADGVAATAGSVLRALGLHTTGALINLTSYYVIGLPFGLWLTFDPKWKLGLVGIWIGLSVALGYASVASFVLVWRTNWTRAVQRVRERLGLPAQGQVGEDGKWEENVGVPEEGTGEREVLLNGHQGGGYGATRE